MLIDTSFVVALANPHDKNHQAAIHFASTQIYTGIMPEVAVTEVFFVTMIRRSYYHAIEILKLIRMGGVDRVQVDDQDLERIEAIMTQYIASKFDLVDTAIMALSERLNITTVLTFDRRDFSIFKPRHADYLELLPELTGK